MKKIIEGVKLKISVYRLNKKMKEFQEVINLFENSVMEYETSMRSVLENITPPSIEIATEKDLKLEKYDYY